jgi:hypothetical protein
MATVSWHVVISVDGYIAAPRDHVSGVFDAWGPSATVDEIVGSTGAIVMGRRTDEVEDRDCSGIYGGSALRRDSPAACDRPRLDDRRIRRRG